MENGAYELEGEEAESEMVEEYGAKDRVKKIYNNICMQCICHIIYKTLTIKKEVKRDKIVQWCTET